MWYKTLKTIVIVLIVMLMCAVGWFANAFLGNPVSWILARGGVNRYVEHNYSGLDLMTERFGYDFKTGGTSPISARKQVRIQPFISGQICWAESPRIPLTSGSHTNTIRN